MKPSFIIFLCLLFSQLAFSQETQDSLKKIRFMYDCSLGARMITVSKFNENSGIKMPPGVLAFSQNYGFGKPYKYFISANISIGVVLGSFFDSKKTSLVVASYGLMVQKGFTVRKKFFIEPFTGWQNAISYSTFSRFILSKSSARMRQDNLLVIGCDFSTLISAISRSSTEYGPYQLGLKLSYQLPLESAQLKEGEQFFPAGIGSFSLGGFSVGIFYRLF